MEDAHVHKLAPDGDVTLLVGAIEDAQVTRIQVSSVVLSLGSSVFEAMLGPHFKEGQALATASRLDLPLPDDDSEIMLILCKVMHMSVVAVDKPTSELLLKLAVMVDKYNCRAALSYLFHAWLRQLRGSDKDMDRVNCLFATYYFTLPEEFTKLGHEIVLESSGAINKEDLVHRDPGLECLIDHLEVQRKRLAEEIATTVQDRIQFEFEGLDGKQCWCDYTSIRGANFVRQLVNTTLWPLTTIACQPLRLTCRGADALLGDWDSRVECCGKKCVAHLMSPSVLVALTLARNAKKVENLAIAPCLRCVKDGYIQLKGHCERVHEADEETSL